MMDADAVVALCWAAVAALNAASGGPELEELFSGESDGSMPSAHTGCL
jgi:hypothetical protein